MRKLSGGALSRTARGARVLLFLIVGCEAPKAASELYVNALQAPDWPTALSSCEAIRTEPNRSDCLTAITERHERPVDDCTRITVDRWAQECRFLYAERAARAGELDAAFAACDGTQAFGRECSYHLIREAARAVLDKPPSEVPDVAKGYAALTRAPDAEQLFWNAYFRERLAQKKPIDPTGCPGQACLDGALHEMKLHLPAIKRSHSDFCAADADTLGVDIWARGAVTASWVEAWRKGPCRAPKPEGPPLAPHPTRR